MDIIGSKEAYKSETLSEEMSLQTELSKQEVYDYIDKNGHKQCNQFDFLISIYKNYSIEQLEEE
ncbi:MAG: hypothetical protein AAFO15_00510 [Pseudomonadota bacterium]